MVQKEYARIGSPENVPAVIAAVKAKKQRLFGYGHRLYKTEDPRCPLILGMIHSTLEEDPRKKDDDSSLLLRIALEIDRIASADDYFVSRGLRANADLYGSLLCTALGFEADIIIALACVSRMGGAMAHWREAMQETPVLWRPRQLYVGPVPGVSDLTETNGHQKV